MKSFFQKLVLHIILSTVFVAPFFVFAGGTGTLTNPIKSTSFKEMALALLDVLVKFGTPLAAFFFVFTGFKFVTSQGDEKKLGEGKEMLKWTIVGTALIVGAYAVYGVIESTVGSITG